MIIHPYGLNIDIKEETTMGNLKTITELNFDSAGSPLRSDLLQFMNKLIRTFYYSPNTIRKLHVGQPLPAEFDGKRFAEVPEEEKGDRPGYEFEPSESNTNLVGTTQSIPMPQIFKTAKMTKDAWKLAFANMERKPKLISAMQEMILQEEDFRGFKGDSTKNIDGLLSNASSDLGAPGGAFDVQSNSDGVLTHLDSAINDAIQDFADANIPADWQINVAMTGKIYALANTTFLAQTGRGKVSNIAYNEQKLNGGKIYSTNNLNGSETAITNTTNEMVIVVMPPDDKTPIWKIVETGFDMVEWEIPPWSRGLAMRKKFAPKIFNNDGIRWMDGIQALT